MTQGIYVFKCVTDGRVYVGSSVRCEMRLEAHQSDLNRRAHVSRELQEAWDDRRNEFAAEIVEVVEDRAELRAREQYWIEKLGAAVTGFNGKNSVAAVDAQSRRLRPDRVGKVLIAGHFPRERLRRLRMAAAILDRTQQDIMEEAIEDLLRKYGG